jgi:uncharacterized protein YjbJ (UPF0337 family)
LNPQRDSRTFPGQTPKFIQWQASESAVYAVIALQCLTTTKGGNVNPDILKGKWNEMKGDIRMRFGKLTDDDMTYIQGATDKLIGKLQERYGYQREQAEKELNSFLNSMPGTRRTA